MKKAILINVKDNVATATKKVEVKETLQILDHEGKVVKEIQVHESIPFGHKIALYYISKGSNIRKYGEVIGYASSDIRSGEWVHVHNLVSSWSDSE